MEISVKLPDDLYRDVSHLAKAQNKSVGAVIKTAVQSAVKEEAIDLKAQKELLKQSIKFCSNKEILAWQNLRREAANAWIFCLKRPGKAFSLRVKRVNWQKPSNKAA